jgi:3-oxoacyl-[acyl-carrier-protein] synthase-3
MAVLFGDGAAAVCIESVSYPECPSFKNQYSGIIDSCLGSDGNGIDALCLVAPGTATKGFLSENTYADGTWHPHMDGRLVFKNAVTRLQEVAEEILTKNNLKSSDIDLLLPHQANLRINQAVSAKLGIPEERVFNNIHKYGNTTAATIPICLSEALEQGRLEKGMLVMSLAFGAGFTWGANIFRW